jgi:hypothetical protein
MKRLAAVFATIALSTLVATAHAGVLNDTVKIEYLYPTVNDVYENLGQGVVGAGGFHVVFQDYFDMTVTDNRITIDYRTRTGPYTVAPFNGFALTDLTKSLPNISLNSATNLAGFGNDNFSVVDNVLMVNWQGLYHDPNTLVVFDIESTTNNVPEPVSLALLGVGLLGFGASRRLRK